MNLSIVEILHILFKRKLLIVGAFFIIFLPIAFGALLRPSLYQASGRLMVSGQQASYSWLSLQDNTRLPGGDPIRVINTEIEHIKSDDFLLKVATALPFSLAEGADKSQETGGNFLGSVSSLLKSIKAVVSFPTKMGTAMATFLPGEAPAIKSTPDTPPSNPSLPILAKSLQITSVPNSSLIDVTYADQDPQRAMKVVNTVLEMYPSYQAKLYHDESALSFYNKQANLLATEIGELEEQIDAFQDKENIVSVADQRAELINLLTRAEDRLRATVIDIDQGRGKIEEVERQLVGQPESRIAAQELADPETRLLNEALAKKQIEKNELLQRYTEKDRRVQDKEGEIASITSRLAAATNKMVVVSEQRRPNDIRQALMSEIVEQKVKLGQAFAKKASIENQVKELNAEMDRLGLKGNELLRLQSALASKNEQHALYTKKAEEARIADAMDKEKLLNVKAVDHAPLPGAPLPNRSFLLLTLACIVGLGTGIALPLALECLRPTFHTALDVERRLEIPVLALVPNLQAQEHA